MNKGDRVKFNWSGEGEYRGESNLYPGKSFVKIDGEDDARYLPTDCLTPIVTEPGTGSIVKVKWINQEYTYVRGDDGLWRAILRGKKMSNVIVTWQEILQSNNYEVIYEPQV